MIKEEYHNGMVSTEISGKIIDIAHELATIAIKAVNQCEVIETYSGINAVEPKRRQDKGGQL